MRQLLFCARDICDYLDYLTDLSKCYLPDSDLKFPPLNDAPAIQQVLRDMSSGYDDCEHCLSAPICGETGIDGLRLDFNFGLRLEVPEGNFHVRIGDADTEQIFFDRDISDVRLISAEKYFIRWHVEVFRDGEKIFDHVINLAGQPVLVAFKKKAQLGDTIACLRSLSEFERRSGCKLTVCLPEYIREFAAQLYPKFKLVDAVNFDNYATFYPIWFAGNIPLTPEVFLLNVCRKMFSA